MTPTGLQEQHPLPAAAAGRGDRAASAAVCGSRSGALCGAVCAAGSRPRNAISAPGSRGRRSLSGYLFQSVAWLLILAPFTLALGAKFESPMITGLLVALLVWLTTIGAAWILDQLGQPGPAEAVLRRLIYGRSR